MPDLGAVSIMLYLLLNRSLCLRSSVPDPDPIQQEMRHKTSLPNRPNIEQERQGWESRTFN
jgi:hypothetical protein